MKKSLVQFAFNPFLDGTSGTRNPSFGYPFCHQYNFFDADWWCLEFLLLFLSKEKKICISKKISNYVVVGCLYIIHNQLFSFYQIFQEVEISSGRLNHWSKSRFGIWFGSVQYFQEIPNQISIGHNWSISKKKSVVDQTR